MTRRIWRSFDATWFSGGQIAVNAVGNPDRQDNVRMSATLSLPLIARQSLKLTYSSGTTTCRGSDYDTDTSRSPGRPCAFAEKDPRETAVSFMFGKRQYPATASELHLLAAPEKAWS